MNDMPAIIVAKGLLARWQAKGLGAVQLHKGDEDCGQILVVAEKNDGTSSLWRQVRDYHFRQVWQPVIGDGDFIDASQIHDKIASERRFDRDLWVLVLELGSAHFDPALYLE